MRRRSLLVVVAVAVAATLAPATGAFGPTTVDRGAVVAVDSDENALLDVETPPVTVAGTAHGVTIATLHNRRSAPLRDVRVTVGRIDRGPTPSNASAVDALGVGESGAVHTDLVCDGTGTDHVEVALTASDATVEIHLTRRVAVRCVPPVESATGANDAATHGRERTSLAD